MGTTYLSHGSTHCGAACLPCQPQLRERSFRNTLASLRPQGGRPQWESTQGPWLDDGSIEDTCERALQGQPARERLVQGALHQRVQVGRIVALQAPRKAL